MLKSFASLLLKPFTSQSRGILLVALFLMAAGNRALFHHLLNAYPLTLEHLPFLLSLMLLFTLATALFLLLLCQGRVGRWLLAVILVLAAQAAYFMDRYGVIVDVGMIENIVQTNAHEATGLLSFALLIRTLLLGLLPAVLVVKYLPRADGWRRELQSRLAVAALLIVVAVAAVAPFGAAYASFFRQHKSVRFYANPLYFSYSLVRYVDKNLLPQTADAKQLTAQDIVEVGAHIPRKELVIVVVGETARADRFALNGYTRPTNPELGRERVVSLTNVSSCGTATSVSVPCMFSVLGRAHFDREKALHTENALEVLARHGVQVLWRDNNSDSKGVALNLPYQSFRTHELNPACDDECRDIGMLDGLDRFIASKKGSDMLIVLHQMGSHGPEYYKRYPKRFERFTPVCKSSDLGACTDEEINNAYDNTILYTDYFLAQVINFLKRYDSEYETAMVYVSDHGESLGERGLYLHGTPYAIAPKEQTHVPAIVWFGEHFDYSLSQLAAYRDYPLSHDDMFCMLLVGFEMESDTVCRNGRDLLRHNLALSAAATR